MIIKGGKFINSYKKAFPYGLPVLSDPIAANGDAETQRPI